MKRWISVFLTVMLLFAVMSVDSPTTSVLAERNIYTVDNSPMLETLMEKATSFILARHYQMAAVSTPTHGR